MASKSKDTQSTRQASLIPVVERQEEQLRAQLEQVRGEAKDRIHQASELAQQHIQESRLSIAELVEDKRREGLAELQKRSEQITQSLEQHKGRLQQQAKNNIDRAVRRVVNAVLGTAYGLTTSGGRT